VASPASDRAPPTSELSEETSAIARPVSDTPPYPHHHNHQLQQQQAIVIMEQPPTPPVGPAAAPPTSLPLSTVDQSAARAVRSSGDRLSPRLPPATGTMAMGGTTIATTSDSLPPVEEEGDMIIAENNHQVALEADEPEVFSPTARGNEDEDVEEIKSQTGFNENTD